MNKKEFIKLIKDLGVYKQGKYICRSGKICKNYWDFRIITLNGVTLRLVTNMFNLLVRESLGINLYHNNITIAGMAISGIPIVSAISYETGCNSIIIRDKPKERGTKQQIEGNLIKGSKVILFDDLLNSGTSMKIMINAIKENAIKGNEILGMFTIFNRSEVSDVKGIPCYSLLTLTDWRNND